jgi:hypothetical protein
VGYVMVDTSAAIVVDYIRADYPNRFAVNASYSKDNPTLINSGFAKIDNVYSTTASDPKSLARYSQVNLNLYNYYDLPVGPVDDDGAFDQDYTPDMAPDGTNYRKTLRNSEGWNYLTGFTPPFTELGADYMFYHTMTAPDNSSMASGGGAIADPYYRMKAGHGYFITMESKHAYHTHRADGKGIDDLWNFFDADVSSIDNTLHSDGISNNYFPTNYGDGIGIFHTRRARGGYVFNRSVFFDYLSQPADHSDDSQFANIAKMDNFSRFYYDANNYNTKSGYAYGETNRPLGGLGKYEWFDNNSNDRSRYELMNKEKFNIGSVTVQLTDGLNFLGNPFMAPISLNNLLGLSREPGTDGHYTTSTGDDDPVIDDETTLQGGTPIKIFGDDINVSSYTAANNNVAAKYWVINQALVKYDPNTNLYTFQTTYDYVSRVAGSTVLTASQVGTNNSNGIEGDPASFVIAPMQMFCVQAFNTESTPASFVIDSTLQVFRKTRFLKDGVSGSVTTSGTGSPLMRNTFVVEADNVENNTADRTAVVFNDRAQTTVNSYDTRKGISKAFETFVAADNTTATQVKFNQSRSIVYTKSSDDEALLGNSIPLKTKELALFVVPPATTQTMKLNFYGLDNLTAVPGVWLYDRMLNKTTKIEPGDSYTYTAAGVADPDLTRATDDNRFVLRFYDAGADVISNTADEVTCYYKASTLYINGLTEDDINSDLTLYDVQGRLMGHAKVLAIPMTYTKYLSTGTYLARIAGKRNFTLKFVNLQN